MLSTVSITTLLESVEIAPWSLRLKYRDALNAPGGYVLTVLRDSPAHELLEQEGQGIVVRDLSKVDPWVSGSLLAGGYLSPTPEVLVMGPLNPVLDSLGVGAGRPSELGEQAIEYHGSTYISVLDWRICYPGRVDNGAVNVTGTTTESGLGHDVIIPRLISAASNNYEGGGVNAEFSKDDWDSPNEMDPAKRALLAGTNGSTELFTNGFTVQSGETWGVVDAAWSKAEDDGFVHRYFRFNGKTVLEACATLMGEADDGSFLRVFANRATNDDLNLELRKMQLVYVPGELLSQATYVTPIRYSVTGGVVIYSGVPAHKANFAQILNPYGRLDTSPGRSHFAFIEKMTNATFEVYDEETARGLLADDLDLGGYKVDVKLKSSQANLYIGACVDLPYVDEEGIPLNVPVTEVVGTYEGGALKKVFTLGQAGGYAETALAIAKRQGANVANSAISNIYAPSIGDYKLRQGETGP